MSNNSQGGVANVIGPWQVDYTGIPVPEPSTLLALTVAGALISPTSGWLRTKTV